MSATERLALPQILPGQAQKEIFHNEALQILDALVAAAVEEAPRTSPPATPVAGTCFIVADGAAGEWLGRDGQLAAFTAGGWRYIPPVEGMTVHVRSSGEMALYRAGSWEFGIVRGSSLLLGGTQVVGPRSAAIADSTGGTVIDVEARAAVTAILAALRQHGLIAS